MEVQLLWRFVRIINWFSCIPPGSAFSPTWPILWVRFDRVLLLNCTFKNVNVKLSWQSRYFSETDSFSNENLRWPISPCIGREAVLHVQRPTKTRIIVTGYIRVRGPPQSSDCEQCFDLRAWLNVHTPWNVYYVRHTSSPSFKNTMCRQVDWNVNLLSHLL